MKIAGYHGTAMIFLSQREKDFISAERVNATYVDGRGIVCFNDPYGPALQKAGKESYRASIARTKFPREWGTWGSEEVSTKVLDDAQHGKILLASVPKRKHGVGEGEAGIQFAREALAKKRFERAREEHAQKMVPRYAEPPNGVGLADKYEKLVVETATGRLRPEDKWGRDDNVEKLLGGDAAPPLSRQEMLRQVVSHVNGINEIKDKMEGDMALSLDGEGYLSVTVMQTYGRKKG